MSSQNKIEVLEKAIARYYRKYSAKRVALGAFVVGVCSLLVSLGVYAWLANGMVAAFVWLLVGFVGINIAFLAFVPPDSLLNHSRDLICGALREPSRLQSYSMQKVQIKDAEGQVHSLSSRDVVVWTKLVVPYLLEVQASRPEAAPVQKAGRTLTVSERKYIEQRRKEVEVLERKIEAERESLNQDRQELEQRSADLRQAEELVIARLNRIEEAQAEVEQLRISAAEQVSEPTSGNALEATRLKAEALHAKEAELNQLKQHLAEARESLDAQKREMELLKGKVTRAPFPVAGSGSQASASAGISLEEREAMLEARQKELEAEAEALAKRADFVADSENSLIARLDELSHREASIEQSEINAGLRKD
jgi:hypothetical protein